MMDIHEVKQKAKELKETIQDALRKFRNETGYTPKVEIVTKERPTNNGKLVSQEAMVTIVM